MSRRSNQKNQPQTKTQKPKLAQELIIDSEDTYKDIDNIFYVHPSHLNTIKSLQNGQFTSVTIKNTPVDDITPFFLLNLFTKMKVGATAEIIIYEPVSVMQVYDARQVEANAKLAGFADIKVNERNYVDSVSQKKSDTLAVTFVRPQKRGSTEVLATVNIEKLENITNSSKRSNSKKVRGKN